MNGVETDGSTSVDEGEEEGGEKRQGRIVGHYPSLSGGQRNESNGNSLKIISRFRELPEGKSECRSLLDFPLNVGEAKKHNFSADFAEFQ